MEDGFLSLKWNNHCSTFLKALTVLNNKENFSDASLYCEGKFFQVHKFVLSTCSDYFADLFQVLKEKNPIVVINNIKKSDLEALLTYMYSGEANVAQNDLSSLIKAAESYGIKGLAVPDSSEDEVKSRKQHETKSKKRKRDLNQFSDQATIPKVEPKYSKESAVNNLEPTVKIKKEEPDQIDDAFMDQEKYNQNSTYNFMPSSENNSNVPYQQEYLTPPYQNSSNDSFYPTSTSEPVTFPSERESQNSESAHFSDGREPPTESYSNSMNLLHCPYPNCTYVNFAKSKMEIHYRTHTGERPFQCPQCSFRATTKSNLKSHLKHKHHTNEVPEF